MSRKHDWILYSAELTLCGYENSDTTISFSFACCLYCFLFGDLFFFFLAYGLNQCWMSNVEFQRYVMAKSGMTTSQCQWGISDRIKKYPFSTAQHSTAQWYGRRRNEGDRDGNTINTTNTINTQTGVLIWFHTHSRSTIKQLRVIDTLWSHSSPYSTLIRFPLFDIRSNTISE